MFWERSRNGNVGQRLSTHPFLWMSLIIRYLCCVNNVIPEMRTYNFRNVCRKRIIIVLFCTV